MLVARADEAEARECLADIENNPPDIEDTPSDYRLADQP